MPPRLRLPWSHSRMESLIPMGQLALILLASLVVAVPVVVRWVSN